MTVLPSRLRCQFKLSTLLLIVAVLCILLARLGNQIEETRQLRHMVAEILDLKGSIRSRHPPLSHHDSLKDVASLFRTPRDAIYETATEVDLGNTNATDSTLKQLHCLKHLAQLDVRYTKVSDSGLIHIRRLVELTDLDLRGTEVTDAGLQQLHDMTMLKRIWLQGTLVTSTGLDRLRQALPSLVVYH